MSVAEFKPIGDFRHVQRVLKTIPQRIRAVAVPAFDAMGAFYAGLIVEGLDSQAPAGQAFKPLAQSTIDARARKRGTASTKALIDTADMRNSVTYKGMKMPMGVFIGLLRTAMHRETGESVANLGEIHEHGTLNGHIPPRPFIFPIARSRSMRRRARGVFRRQVRLQRHRLTR